MHQFYVKQKTTKSFKCIQNKCNKCTNGRTDNNGRTVIHWCFLVEHLWWVLLFLY